MAADDIEVIHMTAVEWDQALTNSLNDVGLTWEDLTAQAKAGDFSSLKARQLWLMAGGQGPNQADVELERLRADVRSAYAEREEMWERKAAALRERDEARRELAEAQTERDRYRLAWQSARGRAQAYGESITRLCEEREWCVQWYEQAEAKLAAIARVQP